MSCKLDRRGAALSLEKDASRRVEKGQFRKGKGGGGRAAVALAREKEGVGLSGKDRGAPFLGSQGGEKKGRGRVV